MNAQTLVLLVIIAALLAFALRHVYHNFVEGKHDCCGCDACSGHHDKEKNTGAEEGSCQYCSGHK